VDLNKPWYFNGQTILHSGLIFHRPRVVKLALEKNLSFEKPDRLQITPSMILDCLSTLDSCKQVVQGFLLLLFIICLVPQSIFVYFLFVHDFFFLSNNTQNLNWKEGG